MQKDAVQFWMCAICGRGNSEFYPICPGDNEIGVRKCMLSEPQISFFFSFFFLKHHMISFSLVWPLSDELIGREEASGLGYLRVSALH